MEYLITRAFSVPGIVPKSCYTFCTFPDYKCADDLAITEALCDSFNEFELISTTSHINTLSTFFEKLVSECVNLFIPLKTKKTNIEIAWLTTDFLHLSRCVARLRRSKHSSDSTKLMQLVSAKNKLSAQMNAAKQSYYNDALSKLMKAKSWQMNINFSKIVMSFSLCPCPLTMLLIMLRYTECSNSNILVSL